MTRRMLVTGVNGFSGRHLAAALRNDPGLHVLGTGRRDRAVGHGEAYRRCDLTDDADVRSLVEWARPDVVFHLAGLRGDADEAELHAVNVGGFERLRGALRASVGATAIRMVVVGSAAEIGRVATDRLPVDESVPCRPTTAYGRAKHAMVRSALAEPAGSGLEIVVARTFNLVGAGLDASLAPAVFAAGVRAVARGEARVIRCGWLGGCRDYLDIADAVRAYRLLAKHGPPGDLVNVCSGESVPLGDVLDRLLAIAGVEARVLAATSPTEHDVADVRGSNERLATLTGWRPRVPIDASLAALYHDVQSDSR